MLDIPTTKNANLKKTVLVRSAKKSTKRYAKRKAVNLNVPSKIPNAILFNVLVLR